MYKSVVLDSIHQSTKSSYSNSTSPSSAFLTSSFSSKSGEGDDGIFGSDSTDGFSSFCKAKHENANFLTTQSLLFHFRQVSQQLEPNILLFD